MSNVTRNVPASAMVKHSPAMYAALRGVLFCHPLGQTGPMVAITQDAYDRVRDALLAVSETAQAGE